jgi:hypothetical protein
MLPSGAELKLKSSNSLRYSSGTITGLTNHPANRKAALVSLALAWSLAGCAHQAVSTAPAVAPTLAGDASHPGLTKGWVDTKLYFGLGPADHPEQGISDARWRDFLDKEVTPRFPSGLSVVDVYGQWKGKDQLVPERLRSKMLVIDYADSEENREKIDAIRAAWKQLTGDQSVLRVTEPADVSF